MKTTYETLWRMTISAARSHRTARPLHAPTWMTCGSKLLGPMGSPPTSPQESAAQSSAGPTWLAVALSTRALGVRRPIACRSTPPRVASLWSRSGYPPSR